MVVGSIGCGGMGSLLIRNLSSKQISCIASDISDLALETAGSAQKTTDNTEVAQNSDILFYSVGANHLEDVVKQTHQHVKPNAIISSQQSVKGPEVEVLKRYFPNNPIIPIHLLFGPGVDPLGQRATVSLAQGGPSSKLAIKYLLNAIGVSPIEISAENHDKAMAEIQVGTHAGFEAMGSAWMATGLEPWDNEHYSDELDMMKRAMTHRIFSNSGDLYSGIAVQNDFAPDVVSAYTKSVLDLFRLYDSADKLRERVFDGRDSFQAYGFGFNRQELPASAKNTHLSLLAVGDMWAHVGTDLEALQRLGTPVFQMKLAMMDLLYSNERYLESCIDNALHTLDLRGDDEIFVGSVTKWNKIIGSGNCDAYKAEFSAVSDFLAPQAEVELANSNRYISLL